MAGMGAWDLASAGVRSPLQRGRSNQPTADRNARPLIAIDLLLRPAIEVDFGCPEFNSMWR
jgi:hypothetical protein